MGNLKPKQIRTKRRITIYLNNLNMKTKRLSITEKDFDLNASKNMIIKAIDTQINNYKLQFLTDWEKDHSISFHEKDEKIKALEEEKKEIIELCRAINSDEPKVDLNISIDLTIKEPMAEYA